ncbi:MAG: hypothetical protein KatS3mg042_0972 [Rhodothermaceae bacterium]|nr:MAG: hypothetical protein KatS3mg042_0972 [Rhodothermaceae bacterium]
MPGARSSRTTRLEHHAGTRGLSVARLLVDVLAGPLAGRHTLLAVCPNSVAVTRAALRAARAADTPLFFAATLNQVDRDGGYTGFSPGTFAAFVREECRNLDLDVPVVLGLDHGGPWKKDIHRTDRLPYARVFDEVLRSLEACLDAGYGLLHIDPTVDPGWPGGVPVEVIVERTVVLMRHAEAYRRRAGYPPVAYEVGTEETGGGLDHEGRFAAFLEALEAALERDGLPRPCFVVGDVGTTLDGRAFDAERARRLAARARAFGAVLKGHYTDDVERPEAYPAAGVGGANIGPGLAAVEYAALMELVAHEARLGLDSGFAGALRRAVVAGGRWRKWLRPDERGRPFGALAPERQAWLIETGSRYVWTHPDVRAARARLYAHLAPHRDADAYVVRRIQEAILRYARAFNLPGFMDRLLAALGESGASPAQFQESTA